MIQKKGLTLTKIFQLAIFSLLISFLYCSSSYADDNFPVDFTIWNAHLEDGSYATYFYVQVYHSAGTLPDDIDSITITGPSGPLAYTKADFGYVDLSFGGVFWIMEPAGPPALGEYSITLVSGSSTGTDTDHQSINRSIPVTDPVSFSPAADETLYSTTPVFSWETVDYLETSLYYRIWIQDDQGNSVYISNRVKNMTSIVVPEGVLLPGQTYMWRVDISDSSDGNKIQNRSQSNFYPFTMAPALSHNAKPAIDINASISWGVSMLITPNNTYLCFDIPVIDFDGVVSNNISHWDSTSALLSNVNSHTVTVTFPDGTTTYELFSSLPKKFNDSSL